MEEGGKYLSRAEFIAKRNEAVAAAYSSNEDLQSISERFGVGLHYVKVIARALGAKRERAKYGSRTPERDTTICEAYLSGRSLEDVGREHGITRERVRQIINSSGFSERHYAFQSDRRVHAREKFLAASARRQEVGRLRGERRELVRTLYNDGLTYEQISTQLNISISCVQNHIWRTGGPDRNASAKKPRRNLTPEMRLEVGERYARGDALRDIASSFGITPHTARTIAYNAGYGRRSNQLSPSKPSLASPETVEQHPDQDTTGVV